MKKKNRLHVILSLAIFISAMLIVPAKAADISTLKTDSSLKEVTNIKFVVRRDDMDNIGLKWDAAAGATGYMVYRKIADTDDTSENVLYKTVAKPEILLPAMIDASNIAMSEMPTYEYRIVPVSAKGAGAMPKKAQAILQIGSPVLYKTGELKANTKEIIYQPVSTGFPKEQAVLMLRAGGAGGNVDLTRPAIASPVKLPTSRFDMTYFILSYPPDTAFIQMTHFSYDPSLQSTLDPKVRTQRHLNLGYAAPPAPVYYFSWTVVPSASGYILRVFRDGEERLVVQEPNNKNSYYFAAGVKMEWAIVWPYRLADNRFIVGREMVGEFE